MYTQVSNRISCLIRNRPRLHEQLQEARSLRSSFNLLDSIDPRSMRAALRVKCGAHLLQRCCAEVVVSIRLLILHIPR